MLKVLKRASRKLPLIKSIILERDKLHSELTAIKGNFAFAPPGHYYSPIPSIEEVKRNEELIFGNLPSTIPGIDLDEPNQLLLLKEFVRYYRELPFRPEKVKDLRYFFEHPYYLYSDAIFLYCMMRHLNPKRIIEVGSGYSSCVILDTNELFCNGSIACKFIEPFPDLLFSLIKEQDRRHITVIPRRLQDVELEEFKTLKENDILFIDSTHVGKISSDVNRIFFEILPRLAPGVHIHFHDIFYPFEYPKQWIYEGRAWNEAYMLRTFLQYNSAFRIVFMNTFLEHFHEQFFQNEMPLCLKDPGGSIWIRKERQ
jgi:predicted O-methyltransferase YrrM